MPRKQPSQTATAAVTAARLASLPQPAIPSHVKLRPEDKPFWDGIVRARARSEWGDADLVVAAQLARCQRDIEVETETMSHEGTVVENQRGTPVMNPRVTVLEQLARREMALMRTLRMGGAALGAVRDKAPARKLQRQADDTFDASSDDDLLA